MTEWPEGLRDYADGFVDALKDPALRPQAVADMRAIDPKVIEQENLITAYMQLGALDVAFEVMQQALEADSRAWLDEWDFSAIWMKRK